MIRLSTLVHGFVTCLMMMLASPLESAAQGNLYSFFVAGHTSGWGGLNVDFVAKFPYIQSRPEIEFGIFAGDMVPAFPDTADWDSVDVDLATLSIPVHFAPGNHDMENRPLFEFRYGDTYFSFEEYNDLFIVLDPNLNEWNISGDQLAWLDSTIDSTAYSVDNIFVTFHQLLWRETDNQYASVLWNSDAGRGDTVNFWTDVFPLFNSLDNQVVMMAGDLGAGFWASDVMFDTIGNVALLATGMGEGSGDNFVVVNVDSTKELSYDLICITDPNINCLGPLENHIPIITSIEWTGHEVIDSSDLPDRSGLNLSSESTIMIYDGTGRLIVQSTRLGSGSIAEISSGLEAGFYLFISETQNSRKVRRFVVTR